MDRDDRWIELTVPASLQAVSLVGRMVGALCEAAKMEATDAFRVELAFVETITNVVKHALGHDAEQEIRARVVLTDDAVEIRLSDAGIAMDPRLNACPTSPIDGEPPALEELPESGMGLFLMHEVMDDVRYERIGDRNQWTLRVGLRPRSREG